MIFLLDTNVLIALIDPAHIQHDAAHDWFAGEGQQARATLPPDGKRRSAHCRQSLPEFARLSGGCCTADGKPACTAGHAFWPDDISVLDTTKRDSSRLLSSGQVTDCYLLALAAAHGGKLATFDRRMTTDAVVRGRQSLHLIN